jgi:tetratricopeptide (TPR) repeat protein
LTLQLIDARTDRHVWSQNYDRTLANALTLQSEVAGEVASQLPVRLAEGPQRSGAPTLDPEAYDLYLRALLAERLLTPRSTLDERRDTEKLLSRAIARDPSFALAHAVRARVRLVTFVFNHDASEEQLRRAREDLDAARKRAGDDPVLLAMDAIYLGFLEQQDRQHVLRIFEAAEAAGLQLPIWKASLLVSMGRLDEAVRVYEDWMMRDPGDAQAYPGLAIALALARRPVEALRTVDRGIAQFPDFSGFARIRAQVVFCFTGQTDEWRAALDGQSRTMSSEVRFESYFDLMRFERRYPELKNMLESATSDSTRVLAGGGGLVGYPSFLAVGDRPIAEYRGWTNLLLGDHATAAEDGRAVLDFVARGKETEWNRWFLRMLEAEGHTFAGRNERAIQSARETLKLMPRSRSAVTWMSAAAVSARVYAWSGAQDEAVGLLEELMNITPGPGPAEITRDPLYALPLAQNARYQALVNRLEAQMRATKLPSVPESLAR